MKFCKRHINLLVGLVAVGFSAASLAMDYRSVAVPRAVMYDAPSAQAKKVYIISQYSPVEVIVNLGDWLKVRDSQGGLAWLEAKSLDNKRTVVVTTSSTAHEAADANSAIVFRADKDVALELLESAPPGWVKVRHRDGLIGYLSATQVWGL